jgi:hypothetical protein
LPRFQGTDHFFGCKETAVNNVNTTSNEQQGKRPEAVALLDCGQASKVTKGVPYLIFWELCPPPSDTALFW